MHLRINSYTVCQIPLKILAIIEEENHPCTSVPGNKNRGKETYTQKLARRFSKRITNGCHHNYRRVPDIRLGQNCDSYEKLSRDNPPILG